MASYTPAVEFETQDGGQGSVVPAPISSSYCVPYSSQITVTSKVTFKKGDLYFIHDSQGQLMFDAKGSGKHSWLHRQRILRDLSGKTLVFLKPKTWSIRDRWAVYGDEEASDSSILFTMSTKGCSVVTPSFQIFLANNQTKTPDFDINGKGFLKYKFTVLHRSSPIAEARSEGDKYNVTVNAGVDVAFISSLTVIVDQVIKSVERTADAVGGVGDGVGGAIQVAF